MTDSPASKFIQPCFWQYIHEFALKLRLCCISVAYLEKEAVSVPIRSQDLQPFGTRLGVQDLDSGVDLLDGQHVAADSSGFCGL